MAPHAALPPSSSSCSQPHQPPTAPAVLHYFGTKTVYPGPPCGAAAAVHAPRNTKLVHVSLIARHGTRNPTKNGIARMKELEAFLIATAPHLPWLPTWSRVLRGYETYEGCLTREGEVEMREIGARFRKRYARLLAAQPSIACSSAKQRAVESAVAFLQGYAEAHRALTRSVPTPAVTPKTKVLEEGDDAVVRYTERHDAYCQFSFRHKKAVYASLKSGRAKRASDIAHRMASELGIPSLRPEHVRVIAESAAFDHALGRKSTSPFAQLLKPDDSPFLEAFDRAYRPVFEGCTRFRALAAPLIRELVDTLRNAQVGRAPAADLKFAHAQTLVPLMLLLGVEGNGLCPRRGEFMPGLSAMSPFAANFCVELFEADGNSDKQVYSKHLVRFRLHERYIASLPALGEHGRDGVVPLERLLEFFDEILKLDDRYQAQDKKRQSSKTGKTAKGSSGALSGGHGHGSLVSVVPAVVTVPAPTQVVE